MSKAVQAGARTARRGREGQAAAAVQLRRQLAPAATHLGRELRHQALRQEAGVVQEVEAEAVLHHAHQVLLQRLHRACQGPVRTV